MRTYLNTTSTFKVNKEKGIVTCVMNCEINNSRLINRGIYNLDVKSWHKGRCPRTEFKVVTMAICSKDDEFSEEIGKRVAESKAKYKAFKQANEYYKHAIAYYKDILNSLHTISQTCEIASIRESERLINEEYVCD